MGENIPKQRSQPGLNFQNVQIVHKIQQDKLTQSRNDQKT